MTRSVQSSGNGFVRPPNADRSLHRAGRVLPAGRPTMARPPSRARRLTRRRTHLSHYVVLAIVGVGAILGARAYFSSAHHTASRVVTAPPAPRAASVWVDPQYLAGFQSQLDGYLAGRPGKYAVAAVDLETGATLAADADTQYRAASVNKLELAIDLYRRAEAHQIDLDATTEIGDDDIQHYGTGTIQLQGSGQSYSYRDLARLMIEESDNTASFVIGKRLGLPSVQADLSSWGLQQTSLDGNLTSARDVALLLSRLQKRELLSDALTREVLSLLENTVWTDRLQSGVPSGVPVAHKIGTDVGVYNDAAIVLDGDRPYVVVTLSSGTGEDDALQSMTRISRLSFQFAAGLPAATRVAQR